MVERVLVVGPKDTISMVDDLAPKGFEIVKVRPHYQRLALGYVLHRATPYIGAPARLAERVFRGLGAGDLQVPYWMGQTLVIARKRPTIN